MPEMRGAVAKGFVILEALGEARGGIRLSALAAGLGLQKSTVHRLLGELIELGYAEQVPTTGLYRPTLKTWELGTAVVADLPVKQASATAMAELHRRTGDTVSLTVRAGDDVLFLDKILSARATTQTTRIGSRVAAPFTAGGTAMLAHSDDAEDVVHRVAQRPSTPAAFDAERVLRQISLVRRSGYAVSSARPEVVSIAAAVFDRDGRPVAALSVSAGRERMDRAHRSEVADAVRRTTTFLGEGFGRMTA